MHDEFPKNAQTGVIGLSAFGLAIADSVRNKNIKQLIVSTIVESNPGDLEALVPMKGLIFLLLDVTIDSDFRLAIEIAKLAKQKSCLVIDG